MTQKLKIFFFGCAPVTLSDIAGNGDGCSSQLIREAKSLRIWKRGSELVDSYRQFNRSLPNDKISE
jgi:hypothetical protein